MYLFQDVHTLLFLNPSLCFVIWMFFSAIIAMQIHIFTTHTLKLSANSTAQETENLDTFY